MTDLFYLQDSRSNVGSRATFWRAGGGVDYWGEGQDVYTVWQDWLMSWEWHGPFETYPEGHRHEYLPDTEGFKPTTRNLLKLASQCQLQGAPL
ncbi:hypothetical protein P3804_11525 [Pseudomonas aeruginosa]|nr:hypothetical protein [Pseudomonas aeruginosa]MDP5927139.1 hypothetical protein [Pseudomonas aeruginosa]